MVGGRRPSERPLLGRLVWSPVTLDAALGAVALIGLAYGAGASVRAGVMAAGAVLGALGGVAPALRPLELPTRPVGKALGLRIGSEGVLVTLQRDLAEAVGVDELAGVAAEVATGCGLRR